MKFFLAILGLAALLAAPARAHELWLEAEEWQVQPGETIRADIINGQLLSGVRLPWRDDRLTRAEHVTPSGTRELRGRLGDIPAIDVEASEPGLHVLVYEAAPTTVTYSDFDKFRSFTEEKGLERAYETHLERDLPQDRVKEVYTRHVKALVAVGEGAGSDEVRGMEIEILAETNPYALARGEAMVVRLFYRDAPAADAPMTIFRKAADGTVTTTLIRTDAEGRARFDVEPGVEYLVDSVVLREAGQEEAAEHNALWRSLWAGLTFGL
ncbi:MAG: DUF4198 domain-containing protein [Pseudooceanicola sp.]